MIILFYAAGGVFMYKPHVYINICTKTSLHARCHHRTHTYYIYIILMCYVYNIKYTTHARSGTLHFRLQEIIIILLYSYFLKLKNVQMSYHLIKLGRHRGFGKTAVLVSCLCIYSIYMYIFIVYSSRCTLHWPQVINRNRYCCFFLLYTCERKGFRRHALHYIYIYRYIVFMRVCIIELIRNF